MRKKNLSVRSNVRLAGQLWGDLSGIASRSLRELTTRYSFSIAAGDLQFLNGRWYVTHAGLLQLASRRRCRGKQSPGPIVRPSCRSMGFQSYRLHVLNLQRLRWVWRCVSVQYFVACTGRRDASGRNPCRQPCAPESLRYRPLFGRGTQYG